MSVPITRLSREAKLSQMRKSLQKRMRCPEKPAKLKERHVDFFKGVKMTAEAFLLFWLLWLAFQTRPGEATAHIPMKRSAAGVKNQSAKELGKKNS